jgi:predicted permease
MSELLSRFHYQESSLSFQVWAAAAVIWLAVLACCISSILAQPFSGKQRALWTGIVVLLPLFGLLAYLPFSIRRDELPTAFLMRGQSKNRDKKPRKPVATITVQGTTPPNTRS